MFSLFKSPNTETEFDHLMSRANELHCAGNIFGLFDLIKITMLPIQSKHISGAYFQKDHGALSSIRLFTDLGLDYISDGNPSGFLDNLGSEKCKINTDQFYKVIHLGSDIILPTSWHPSSIVDMLGQIGNGEDYKCGEFKQSLNHMVVYTYSIDIAWVSGGNHSIVQGILRAEGKIIPDDIFDLTELIQLVRFDGEWWRSLDSNEKIGQPRYQEFGWIWAVDY